MITLIKWCECLSYIILLQIQPRLVTCYCCHTVSYTFSMISVGVFWQSKTTIDRNVRVIYQQQLALKLPSEVTQKTDMWGEIEPCLKPQEAESMSICGTSQTWTDSAHVQVRCVQLMDIYSRDVSFWKFMPNEKDSFARSDACYQTNSIVPTQAT